MQKCEYIFRKIEQVKELAGVLKSSAPKDTDVIASMAQADSDPQPTLLRRVRTKLFS